MIRTTLVPGVAWPAYVCTGAHIHVPGRTPVIQPGILAHLAERGSSTPQLMHAAGLAKSKSTIYKALREMLDLGEIVMVPSPPGAHHSLKCYRLKEFQ